MITLSVVPIVMSCFWSEWLGNGTALLMIEILLGITALFLAKSSLGSSQNCKAIYDNWVMHYGPAPDKWPTPIKPE